ncbi:MAG TPA: LysM domain-containing protein [Desulfosporosinus sp.]|nr:LysM domain-containing protein [Desulfosporosinus sp.]
MSKEYYIQPGDDFHVLAQRWGGTCNDFLMVNPSVDPLQLQVGQKIVLPDFKGAAKGQAQYANISADHGQEFVGEYLDEVEVEVEGVSFRVRRIGEPKIPHEIHLILPRAEIHKFQPNGEGGPCETQIMLSNMDIVLSPRLVSGKGDSAEKAKPAALKQLPEQTQAQAQTQTPQTPS